MKHLKKFNENFQSEPIGKVKETDHEFAEQIANDLFPRYQKMREQGQKITVDDFDKYMRDKNVSNIADSVMHQLVEMGFDFDIDQDDRDTDEENWMSRITGQR